MLALYQGFLSSKIKCKCDKNAELGSHDVINQANCKTDWGLNRNIDPYLIYGILIKYCNICNYYIMNFMQGQGLAKADHMHMFRICYCYQ